MPFNDEERKAMLELKGVGATVIARLEQLGFTTLAELKEVEATDITRQIADMLRTSCWRNSPQANASIQSIIALAKRIT